MCVFIFYFTSIGNILIEFSKVVTYLTLLVLDLVLYLLVIVFTTMMSIFDVFQLLVSHGDALILRPLLFSLFYFLSISLFLGVTVDFFLV